MFNFLLTFAVACRPHLEEEVMAVNLLNLMGRDEVVVYE